MITGMDFCDVSTHNISSGTYRSRIYCIYYYYSLVINKTAWCLVSILFTWTFSALLLLTTVIKQCSNAIDVICYLIMGVFLIENKSFFLIGNWNADCYNSEPPFCVHFIADKLAKFAALVFNITYWNICQLFFCRLWNTCVFAFW